MNYKFNFKIEIVLIKSLIKMEHIKKQIEILNKKKKKYKK